MAFPPRTRQHSSAERSPSLAFMAHRLHTSRTRASQHCSPPLVHLALFRVLPASLSLPPPRAALPTELSLTSLFSSCLRPSRCLPRAQHYPLSSTARAPRNASEVASVWSHILVKATLNAAGAVASWQPVLYVPAS